MVKSSISFDKGILFKTHARFVPEKQFQSMFTMYMYMYASLVIAYPHKFDDGTLSVNVIQIVDAACEPGSRPGIQPIFRLFRAMPLIACSDVRVSELQAEIFQSSVSMTATSQRHLRVTGYGQLPNFKAYQHAEASCIH